MIDTNGCAANKGNKTDEKPLINEGPAKKLFSPKSGHLVQRRQKHHRFELQYHFAEVLIRVAQEQLWTYYFLALHLTMLQPSLKVDPLAMFDEWIGLFRDQLIPLLSLLVVRLGEALLWEGVDQL